MITPNRNEAGIAGAMRLARNRLAEFHEHRAAKDDMKAATALEHFVWYQAHALECGATIEEVAALAEGRS